jgi:ABC-type Fe3+/spermidine/putrescine transport system ATPase subunit
MTTLITGTTQATEQECVLAARQVSKFYGDEHERVLVLDSIDLELRAGEFIALLGPSGSGKSTLLRILAGLIKPSRGEVLAHEQPLQGTNPQVAIVFQSFALYPWLTVQENVELGLLSKAMTPKERRERALAAIDLIGLDGFETAYPRELSGGMKQRVGFARALVVEPEVLFLDHPRLLGIASLRTLLTAEPGQTLAEVMQPISMSIPPEADAFAVAERMSAYHLVTLPVVDGHGQVQGVIPVDAVFDRLLGGRQQRRLRHLS